MTADTLPDWLRPLAELSSTIEAEVLSPTFVSVPDDARAASVLMLFADGVDGPELLLTERGLTMRNHAGQIAFPGGKADPGDADAIQTALREAQEEVGLDPATVDVFGVLPTLWLPITDFAVTPVLGYWREPKPLLSTSDHEVVTVIHRPIRSMLDPANRFSVAHPSGYVGPAFDVGTPMPLWGFTAGVVSRLFAALGWEEPWDTSVLRELPPKPRG